MCDVVIGTESSCEPLDTEGSLILHQPDVHAKNSMDISGVGLGWRRVGHVSYIKVTGYR